MRILSLSAAVQFGRRNRGCNRTRTELGIRHLIISQLNEADILSVYGSPVPPVITVYTL